VSGTYPDIVGKLEQIANVERQDLGDDLTGNEGSNRRQPGRIPDNNKFICFAERRIEN
jgi:arylsulfatase